MKTLVIINEPFAEMLLGKSSTLAYILVAAEFSDVYIWNFAEDSCVKLSCEQAEILTKKFKKINRQIRDFAPKTENIKVKNLIKETAARLPKITAKDLIIQRLEPMKAPFPPVGHDNIDHVLLELRTKFSQHIFNCPIGLHDKELKEFGDIATPTVEFKLKDKSYAQAIEPMGDAYDKIYKNGKKKVVIKPKNLAQSLGVFSIDLSSFIPSVGFIKKLCFEHGEEFFREEILVQPFLEGIRQGDIRATITKDKNGDFRCVGFTFRKTTRDAESEDFTTGYIVGGSTPRPISQLTKNEQKDLLSKCEKVLHILNGELREKYYGSIELGVDFILVGNGKEVLLGEINHHCPGLIPICEAMGEESEYDGGLGLVRKMLKGW